MFRKKFVITCSICCVKIHHKAVKWYKNNWYSMLHLGNKYYGLLTLSIYSTTSLWHICTLKKFDVQLYQVNI